jgi:hypothetical protein
MAFSLMAFGYPDHKSEPEILRSFDEQAMERYVNDHDFRYLHRNPSNNDWSSRFWAWVEKQIGTLYHDPFGAKFFEYAPVVLSVGLTGYILYLWLGTGIFSPFYRNTQHFHAFEALSDSPADVLGNQLQEAKAQGNWALALRCQFILMVNELHQRGVLVYKPDKTNPEYMKEMPAGKPKELFRSMANMFDFVHYGQFPCSESDFRQFEAYYQQLKAQLVKS